MVAVNAVNTHADQVPDYAHVLCVPRDAVTIEAMKQCCQTACPVTVMKIDSVYFLRR